MVLTGPWDIASVAADLASQITASGIDPVLVGHPTGGAIALKQALDHPQLVAGLVVVNSGAHMQGHGDVGVIVKRIRDGGAEAIIDAVLERSLAATPPEREVAALHSYARAVDPRAALEVLDSQRALDFTDLVANLACPVAVVHGRHDRV